MRTALPLARRVTDLLDDGSFCVIEALAPRGSGGVAFLGGTTGETEVPRFPSTFKTLPSRRARNLAGYPSSRSWEFGNYCNPT
eukprot:8710957-Pyramimonas_sp.AAC.1